MEQAIPMAEEYLAEALAAFDFGAPVSEAVRYGEGHINDTFCVTTQAGTRYILQRISAAAFSVHRRAEGWGENTMALRALRAMMDL